MVASRTLDEFRDGLKDFYVSGRIEEVQTNDFRIVSNSSLLILILDTEDIFAVLQYENNEFINIITKQKFKYLAPMFADRRQVWIRCF